VVADFGIAKAISDAGGDQLTESGLAVGTPAYMSPEQASGEGDVDARSDIYSLACVLYEMLVGSPPYVGPSAQAIIARKALDPVPRIRVVRDTVPVAVERAVMRALARVPADRFATAWQFADVLSAQGPAAVAAPRVLAFARSRPLAVAAVIVVIAAATYLGLALRGGGSREEQGVVASSFTRLTADPGVEWFPSLSPDGQWLVYSGESSGNRDVYLLRVGGRNAINLTEDSPADDDQPAFSRDGERIAFRSEREGGGIFVMGRTGEAVRRVTQFGYRPSWNPDGTQIAFVTENVELNPQNAETVSELWVADVRTGETRRISAVDATLPSWSPTGRRIAFFHRFSQQPGGHVWTVPAEGGEFTPLTHGAARDWSPAWSPDGRYVYFASDRGGSMNLWRVRVDEGSGRPLADPEPVVTPATSVAHVSLSADGKQLVYSSVLVTSNVQRAEFDPVRGAVVGEPEWITRGSRRWANPAPSPDGEHVVFYSLVQPEGHLYVMRADGTGRPRQLTGDSAQERVPRWSPDGSWIAAFSDRGGRLQIWKIRPDGSGLTQLTDAPSHLAYPVWSPDGSRMAASTVAGPETYVFDPNQPWSGQEPQVLPVPPDSLAPFAANAWSPDGQRLAGTGVIAGRDRGIILYTLASRTYERLTDFGQWPVWLPDSRRLLLVADGRAFYLLDRETRQVRQVFAVTRDVIGPPQPTPDGRAVYFTRRVTEADIWLLTLP